MAIFRNPVTVLFLLVTINVFGHAIGAAINRNMSAQEVIDLIPPEERGHFITVQLGKAVKNQKNSHNITVYDDEPDEDVSLAVFVFSQEQEDKYKDIDIPEDFSDKLLNWVEENMATFGQSSLMSPSEARRRRGRDRTVCNTTGCIDPSDIGNVCCPF